MTTSDEAGRGAVFTTGRVACGAAVVAWLLLSRRVRALERRADAVARKVERTHQLASRPQGAEVVAAIGVARGAAVVAAAAADVAELHTAHGTVRELIRRAEEASREYAGAY